MSLSVLGMLKIFGKKIAQCFGCVQTADCECSDCGASYVCPPDCPEGTSSTASTTTCADGVQVTCWSECSPSPVEPTLAFECRHYSDDSPIRMELWSSSDGSTPVNNYLKLDVSYSYDEGIPPPDTDGIRVGTRVQFDVSGTITATLPPDMLQPNEFSYDLSGVSIVYRFTRWWKYFGSGGSGPFQGGGEPVVTNLSPGVGCGHLSTQFIPCNPSDPVSFYDDGHSPGPSITYNYSDPVPCCWGSYEATPDGTHCCPSGYNYNADSGQCCPPSFLYDSSVGKCIWVG